MYALEFQSTIQDIITAVPEDKQDELLANINDKLVRILILPIDFPYVNVDPPVKLNSSHYIQSSDPAINVKQISEPKPVRENLTQDAQAKGYSSFVQYLMDYPIHVPNVQYLTRDEAHER